MGCPPVRCRIAGVTRRTLFLALALLALATLIRILVINALPDQGWFAKYFLISRDRLPEVSPGYYWLLMALRALGMGAKAIRTLQIVWVSVAAGLAGDAARRIAGPVAGVSAAVLLLGSKAALVCATDFEPETLILLLNAIALWLLVTKRHVLAGLFLGLSAICRPVALLALPSLWGRRFALALGAAFSPVVVMLGINVMLTGEAVLMDPGTVFYEGMNPSATGYAGVQPKIVTDLQAASRQPDYLHVAYRLVASKASHRSLTRAESNRYWTGKAFAFMRAYPGAALALTARKALYALQSYDPWDLVTMQRKAAQLPWLLFIPFGFTVALAAAGVLIRRREVAPIAWFALATGLVLAVFYVTARQRNAVLPALAILGGTGVAGLRERRGLAIGVLLTGILLTLPTHAQREDAPERYDDALQHAIDLERHGDWQNADALLAPLGDQPRRGTHAVPSIAYYRAVAAAHLGRDPRPFLEQATTEAPGNEHVLAMRAVVLHDEAARAALFELHDLFTAKAALFDADLNAAPPSRLGTGGSVKRASDGGRR